MSREKTHITNRMRWKNSTHSNENFASSTPIFLHTYWIKTIRFFSLMYIKKKSYFLYRLCLCPKEHFFHLLLQRRSVVLSSSSSHKLCIVFTNYYASHSLTFKKIQSSKLLSMRNVLKVKAQKQSHHMWSSHHLTPFSNRTA